MDCFFFFLLVPSKHSSFEIISQKQEDDIKEITGVFGGIWKPKQAFWRTSGSRSPKILQWKSFTTSCLLLLYRPYRKGDWGRGREPFSLANESISFQCVSWVPRSRYQIWSQTFPMSKATQFLLLLIAIWPHLKLGLFPFSAFFFLFFHMQNIIPNPGRLLEAVPSSMM